MMEAVRTSETSVHNYFTRRYIPEDNSELQVRNDILFVLKIFSLDFLLKLLTPIPLNAWPSHPDYHKTDQLPRDVTGLDVVAALRGAACLWVSVIQHAATSLVGMQSTEFEACYRRLHEYRY
jgi:hypothetical protein